jgi:membrane associated rhomboid family serine protease
MLGLLVFGPIVEMRLGAKRFLFFYFATAFGAGIIYSLIHLAEVYPFVSMAREFLASPDPDVFARLVSQSQGLAQGAVDFVDAYSRQPNDPAYREAASQAVGKLIYQRENVPMVGASGAVYGVMLGFAYLFPNLRMMLLFPPIPVQAKYLVGFYAVAALFYAVERVPGDNVAHYAHLGGMLVGWLILRFWKFHPTHF